MPCTQVKQKEDAAPEFVVSGILHCDVVKVINAELTGGEGSLTQWVHCEFIVSFEVIHPVITQQVCGEFF